MLTEKNWMTSMLNLWLSDKRTGEIMKKSIRYTQWLIPMILIALLLPASSSAVEKKAQVGYRFLEHPVSAAALGRGDNGILGLTGSESVFSNPSAVAWMPGKADVNMSRTLWIADMGYNAISGAVKGPLNLYFVLDYMGMDYGDFYGTIRAENVEGFTETGVFSPAAWAAGFSVAQRVSDRFSYGIRIKYAYQELGNPSVATAGSNLSDTALVIIEKKYSHGEPAIDIGTTYSFGSYGIRFGAVIQNFSREIQIEREKFPMPFRVGFSADMDLMTLIAPDMTDVHSLRLGVESIHPRDFRERVKLGLEYSLQDMFIARTGYLLNYDERGLTAGMGVKTKLGGTQFEFNYGLQEFGRFKSVHTFSAGFGF